MKKNKSVIQNDIKDCGISCMQWIIKYYDGYVPLEKLREDTYTNINGTNAYHIVNAFKKWGFDSCGLLDHNITNSELKLPLIAHLKLSNGLEHFCVVKNINHNTIYIMDPSIGNKKMQLSEFNSLFTGNIILAIPREKIIKMENDITIGNLFFNILKKEKSLIIKIVLISILWTIFIIISSYYLKVGSNIIASNINYLKYGIICFGVVVFIKLFLHYIREYYNNYLSNYIDLYIYPWFIKHLFFLPLKNIKSRTVGEIMTRVNELASVKSLFSDIFVSCFLDLLMMLIAIVILFLINVKLTVILIIFLVLYSILGVILNKITYHKILENIDYQTEFNSFITESIDMFASIKHLNITDKILLKIENKLSKYMLSNFRFNRFFNNSEFCKDFIIELCFFIINSVGFWNVYHGGITIVDLFIYNFILSYCIDPVKSVISLLPKFNYIKATFSKLTEFINIEEEKNEKVLRKVKGDILFRNVQYSYNNYDYILNNISFVIKEGSHVLLDGISGSGKSTICKILYGELDNIKGLVSIGNINIKDYKLSELRESILYISQNENLYTGSIKENICADRIIDNELFDTVCNICEIESIVSKRKFRYDSLIEPALNNISGGERQRIILARGLLKDANIIILDEALSEVDMKLEQKIIKNIKLYFKDKTIIYISHKNQSQLFKNIIRTGKKNELFQS